MKTHAFCMLLLSFVLLMVMAVSMPMTGFAESSSAEDKALSYGATGEETSTSAQPAAEDAEDPRLGDESDDLANAESKFGKFGRFGGYGGGYRSRKSGYGRRFGFGSPYGFGRGFGRGYPYGYGRGFGLGYPYGCGRGFGYGVVFC